MIFAGWLVLGSLVQCHFRFSNCHYGFFPVAKRKRRGKEVVKSNCRLDALGWLCQFDWVSDSDFTKELNRNYANRNSIA